LLRLIFIVLFLFIHNKLCYGNTFLASKDLGLSIGEMGQALTENISCWDSTQLWRCLFNVTFFWSRKWGLVWIWTEIQVELAWKNKENNTSSSIFFYKRVEIEEIRRVPRWEPCDRSTSMDVYIEWIPLMHKDI
jgi:hypothetical protein